MACCCGAPEPHNDNDNSLLSLSWATAQLVFLLQQQTLEETHDNCNHHTQVVNVWQVIKHHECILRNTMGALVLTKMPKSVEM